MTRPLVRPLAIVLVSIAVISLGMWLGFRAAGGSISLGGVQSQSGKEYRHSSNISRKQYLNALSRWNNLHATEYEAVVQSTNLGKWKIVVHVDKPEDVAPTGHAHRIVDLQTLDGSRFDMTADLVDSISFGGTVGGLFDELDSILYCQEHSCREQDFFTPMHYTVEFDSTMGYPHSITSTNEYATVETRIENVRVLK